MLIVLFEYRMRKDADVDAHAAVTDEMYRIVSQDPRYGFLGMDCFQSDHGTTTVIERFADPLGMEQWVRDPAHQGAQRRRRTEFFEWYRIVVSAVTRGGAPGPRPRTLLRAEWRR